MPLAPRPSSRNSIHPPWIGEAHVTVLVLNRPGRHDTASMVKQIAGDRELPDHLVTQIVERTDGVPLFVEELTKSILESRSLRGEGRRYVLDVPCRHSRYRQACRPC
jgi:predicted ATPase